MKMVSASFENVRFLEPIHHGHIAKITGRVSHAGNVKAEIIVEAFCSHPIQSGKAKCA